MLSKAQEKLIRSLDTRKGRQRNGLCLVEGQKNIETAGSAIEFTFTKSDTKDFDKLVTTETPQDIAGVARIPHFTDEEIEAKSTIIVLDGVQDPGNVGTIIRLCLGFDAALLLIESADVTNPKVVRASAGAMFQTPWKEISRQDAVEAIENLHRPVYRLEKSKSPVAVEATEDKIVIIAGSEGKGIQLKIKGKSLSISHDAKLESLNVSTALAIILSQRY